MEEVWKKIDGYDNYWISNTGQVKSKFTILKTEVTDKGYLRVDLCKDGKRKHFRVHRLVAIAFLDNPSGYDQVNHKDENPANNSVDNLEWCDAAYNNSYGGHEERSAVKAKKPVMVFMNNGVSAFESVSQAMRKLDISYREFRNMLGDSASYL